MSFTSWLQNLRSALTLGRGQCNHGRRGSVRAATHRPNIEVLEDRSLLSFSPAASFPVGATSAASQQAVVSADFNHDDKLDLATRNENGTVSVLMGDGLGGFGAANLFAVGSMFSFSYSLAVADFNNDGNPDLATIGGGFAETGSYFPQASVLLGNGDGTFQPSLYIYSSLPSGEPALVAVGDFNADGNPDFVCTYSWVYDPDNGSLSGYSAVEVLLGDGQGGFTDTYEYRLQDFPYGLAVADLNADDKPDVVTVDYSFGYVSVLMGLGDGLLSNERVFATGQRPHSVAVGDFTGDGIPDLVTGALTVDILPGLGDGTFAPPIHHPTNGYALAVRTADFNGDGKLDVVTADGPVSVLLGRGDGTLNSPIDHAAGSYPYGVAIGDFNGDGRSDVATADRGSNMSPTTILSTVMVLLNDGNWSLPPQPPPPSIAISDVTVTEGNTGTVNATFTLTLSFASTVAVLVHYDTAAITAAAGSDYTAASGDVIIPAGQTSRTFTVAVKGDRLVEPTETFAVNLSAPINGTIGDGQGIGAILDNEPSISISDVTKKEGNGKKTTLFVFTVTLSAAYDQPVTMSYRTVDGTATTGDNDYVARTGTLTFAPGETTKTITIEVKGDSTREANEMFYLDLVGNSSDLLFAKNRGLGTILNDD